MRRIGFQTSHSQMKAATSDPSSFNPEKGTSFVVARRGGEEVQFFEEALNEVKPGCLAHS